MQSIKIPIAMVCDKNFVMQTCVALTSIYLNKADNTSYEIHVIIADADEKSIDLLERMSREGFRVTPIKTTLENYQFIKQLAHISVAGLLKFEICDLLPQYDKILYLDGDIIVRQDLSELYETDLGDCYAAAAIHSIGVLTGEKKLNSGVLLFNAKKIREEGIREVLFAKRHSLGDRRSMDQETFCLVFGENRVILPPKYNIMVDKVEYEKKYYSLKEYNAYFNTSYKSRKEMLNTACVIHFTGAIKPWVYNFARCGKEWLKYYKLTFEDGADLKLKTKKAYYIEQIKKYGWKKMYWLMKDKVLCCLGEWLHVFPDRSHGDWN